jgi:hypothetical protein|tara:strand:- start:537 stop:1139 length:603 start_codon:yes stop_codon:yes gene_type:complete
MEKEEFLKFRSEMKAPIPGQSLTNDPDSPAPYEQPPRFTNVHDATLYLWSEITDPEMYVPVMEGLADGLPVLDVVQTILFGEFQRGSFNPDLLLMLVEPLSYMYIALGERLDIDLVIYSGELDDEDQEEKILGVKYEEAKIVDMKKAAQAGRVPEGILTDAMKTEMDSLPKVQAPSLMEKPALEAPVTEPQPSLMAPQQG